jgi:nucleotide-binding universal stress UspA family protein
VAGDVPALLPPDPEKVSEDLRRFCDGTPSEPLEIIVKAGHATGEIVATAEQLPADIVVMGTHGRVGVERLLLGSVTEHVLRTTRVPVLTVPPGVEERHSVIYKRILCPVEFSDPSLRAVEYALSLAEETNARLVLLHVIEGVIDPSHLREASHFSVPEYYQSPVSVHRRVGLTSTTRPRLAKRFPEQPARTELRRCASMSRER